MFLHVDDVCLSALLSAPHSDGPVQTAADQDSPPQGQAGHTSSKYFDNLHLISVQSLLTFHMTIQTVDLLQVRSGVDEDERGDHGGVSSLGSRVGGTLTSTNHHHLLVPAHTRYVLTSLYNPNLHRRKSDRLLFLVSDLWCLLSEVEVQPLTEELLIVFDIPQHEVVPQSAHSCSVGQTLLVQLYEDVDDEVVVGTF